MPQVLSVLRKRPRASRGMLLPVSTLRGSAAGRASSVHSLGGGRASGSPQGGVSDAQQVSANSNLSPVLSLGSAEGHSRGAEHTEAGRHLFGAYGRQRVVQVFSTGQPQLPTCHRPPKTPPESWVERFLRVTGMEPVGFTRTVQVRIWPCWGRAQQRKDDAAHWLHRGAGGRLSLQPLVLTLVNSVSPCIPLAPPTPLALCWSPV